MKDSIDRAFMAKYGADLPFERMQVRRPRVEGPSARLGSLRGQTASDCCLQTCQVLRLHGAWLMPASSVWVVRMCLVCMLLVRI